MVLGRGSPLPEPHVCSIGHCIWVKGRAPTTATETKMLIFAPFNPQNVLRQYDAPSDPLTL